MKTASGELASLKHALTALESSRPGDALEPLLTAWRLSRTPRLADLVERLSPHAGARPAALPGKTAKARHVAWLARADRRAPADLAQLLGVLLEGVKSPEATERLEKLEGFPPDPRRQDPRRHRGAPAVPGADDETLLEEALPAARHPRGPAHARPARAALRRLRGARRRRGDGHVHEEPARRGPREAPHRVPGDAGPLGRCRAPRRQARGARAAQLDARSRRRRGGRRGLPAADRGRPRRRRASARVRGLAAGARRSARGVLRAPV
jgi:hypothetical protein